MPLIDEYILHIHPFNTFDETSVYFIINGQLMVKFIIEFLSCHKL